MTKEYLKPIKLKRGELITYRDWECDGVICMENAQTIERYHEINQQDADWEGLGIFAAFSKEQYNESYNHFLETGQYQKDDVIYHLGYGVYGKKDGLKKLIDFYENRTKKIAAECEPQEIYYYECANHECAYTHDDTKAFETVEDIFGKDVAKTILRFDF